MPSTSRSVLCTLFVAGAAATFAGCSYEGGGGKQTLGPAADPTIPGVAANRGFTTLTTAVQTAGLVEALQAPGPFTVFAPTNSAFAAVPNLATLLEPAQRSTLQSILTYHVLAGAISSGPAIAAGQVGAQPATLQGTALLLDVFAGNLYVNEAKVIATDVGASNGVIHAIDRVILPRDTIVNTLNARGFTTLVGAVGSAGLGPTLSGSGPFTVFAPTNAAFAAISGTVASLTPTQLAAVLTYHVVSGSVRASTAAAAGSSPTVNGQTLSFATIGDTLTINAASEVLLFNIPCTNGVIHVIDTVLIPSLTGVAQGDVGPQPRG
jgi:transforming growth factor-beta-induced protein